MRKNLYNMAIILGANNVIYQFLLIKETPMAPKGF